MEIKNNASKLIKPSTPTPSTLRNYNISFFDELQPDINVPVILYYSASQSDSNNINIFNNFESSLSKALTIFYPLAGRYVRDNLLTDCSDQGALYVQAKANFQLTKFLSLAWELKLSIINKLLACEIHDASEIHNPLLAVKVTNFQCGGFAISMCFSHKFADMSTMCTFIDTWATISQEIDNTLELGEHSPNFFVAHHYPKTGSYIGTALRSSVGVNISVRAFLFKGKAISEIRKKLKVKDNGSHTHRPSKVQVVESLLWKAFVSLDKANNGQFSVSTITQAVNLRNVVVPKFSNNLCGNLFTVAVARIDPRERINIDLQELYDLLHESIKNIDNYAKALTPGRKEYEVLLKPIIESNEYITNSDVNAYLFTSWCKFSFNNANFGWGKPVWRSTGNMKAQNYVIMMDDKEGDGVEAWVHLDEKRMCQLEQDPDIQTYAYLVQ